MPEGLSTTARRLVGRYRVVSGKGFRLAGIDPADTAGLDPPRRGRRRCLAKPGNSSRRCRTGSVPTTAMPSF